MDWNKKLLYFPENQDFEDNKSNILDTSIVFIKDSNKIYTHGEEYQFIGWSVLEAPIVIKQFTVKSDRGYGSQTFSFEEGMTFREFINSQYNGGEGYVKSLEIYNNYVMVSYGASSDYYIYMDSVRFVHPDEIIISDTVYKFYDEK